MHVNRIRWAKIWDSPFYSDGASSINLMCQKNSGIFDIFTNNISCNQIVPIVCSVDDDGRNGGASQRTRLRCIYR